MNMNMTNTTKVHKCLDCGGDFNASQSKQKRCPECQTIYRIKRPDYLYPRTCIDCGANFKAKSGRTLRCDHCKTHSTCKVCDASFIRNRETQIYCSDRCSAIGKYDKYFNGNYSVVLKRDNWCCVKCSSTEKLHVHHIDHSGGNKSENLLANNDPKNLVTLCEKCHSAVHTKTDKHFVEKYKEEVVAVFNEFMRSTL